MQYERQPFEGGRRLSLRTIIAAVTLVSASTTDPVPFQPGGAMLAWAWEARYEVLAPRCGYRPEDWAEALDRVLRLPAGGFPAMAEGDATVWQLGAVAGAKLAGRHLLTQFGVAACEVFVDGASLAEADRAVRAQVPAPFDTPRAMPVPDVVVPPDWLETAWPEAVASLLGRCGARSDLWQADARAKLLAGSELWARAEALPMTADARRARFLATNGVLDMLDAAGGYEFDAEGASACASVTQSDAASALDRLVATNPVPGRRRRARR